MLCDIPFLYFLPVIAVLSEVRFYFYFICSALRSCCCQRMLRSSAKGYHAYSSCSRSIFIFPASEFIVILYDNKLSVPFIQHMKFLYVSTLLGGDRTNNYTKQKGYNHGASRLGDCASKSSNLGNSSLHTGYYIYHTVMLAWVNFFLYV